MSKKKSAPAASQPLDTLSADQLERLVSRNPFSVPGSFRRRKAEGPIAYAGFDAEWVTVLADNGWRNDVLSYQLVLDGDGGRTSLLARPDGPEPQHRWTLQRLVAALLKKALRERTISQLPAEIVIFGHFLRGDVTTLADFSDRRTEFRGLGKTVVSGRAGHLVEVGSNG